MAELWPFPYRSEKSLFCQKLKKQPFLDFERVGLKILNFRFQNLKDNFFPDFLRYFASIYLFGKILKKIIEMSKMGCFIAIALLL